MRAMLQGGGVIHWHAESGGHPAPVEAAAAVLPVRKQHRSVHVCVWSFRRRNACGGLVWSWL